jgi:antitoxin FitA
MKALGRADFAVNDSNAYNASVTEAGACMSTLNIRNLDPSVKAKLRVRAARHGRSMEEEARNILRAALAQSEPGAADLGERIRRRFAAVGGVELEIPPREPVREPPKLGLGK